MARQTAWDPTQLESPHEVPEKARRVRAMFEAIAPTYQLVNTLFSGGRDQGWRRKTIAQAKIKSTDRVLDVACGTGDLARTAWVIGRPQLVVGCDFAMNMLSRATLSNESSARWVQGDAQTLPFAPESFDVVTCAFGVRNFQHLDAALREMARVLTYNGRAAILEFTRPDNRLWRRVYEFYASRIMPIGATWISRDRTGAYRYLPRSVVSFENAESLCRRLVDAGFGTVRTTRLIGGVVTIYLATR